MWPRNVISGAPVATFQVRAVLSRLLVASCCPSGVMASEVIASWWPMKVSSCVPLETFQDRAMPSLLPERSV
jgi:hypothetical protein